MNRPNCSSDRLVISGRAWHRLRPLLVEDRPCATGRVRIELNGETRELLVDQLEPERRIPRGQSRPPMEDWALVLVDHERNRTPEDLLAMVQPRRSQRLVVIVLRLTEEMNCQAALWDEGRIGPIEQLWVNGPGMLRLNRERGTVEPGAAESDIRWSRTRGVLGDRLLGQLRNQTVTLVGAGRVGSQMAFQLAALGVAALRIIDGDRLERENLDAMPGLSASDVGQLKAKALARRLCEFRPDMRVSLVATPVTTPAARALLRRRSDLLVTCVDNDAPRLAASIVAREQITTQLDVGTSIQRRDDGGVDIAADVRLLLPGEGCVACVGGLDDAGRRLYDVAAPPGVLSRGTPRAWHEQRAGSLITINALAVSVGVQAWLDLCGGQLTSSYWHRLEWQAGTGLVVDQGAVGAAADCRFCHRALDT